MSSTKKNSLLVQNIQIALTSIKSQLLRAILTMLIIAIGITALVGILTAIDAIKNSISNEFTSMGANTFSIVKKWNSEEGDENRVFEPINIYQAKDFIDEYQYPATMSVSASVTWTANVKYASEKTNPNVQVTGCDENHLLTSGYKIDEGRNITRNDLLANARVALIGREIANNIFKGTTPIDKVISIGGGKYKVIGVLKEKGNASGFGGDRICLVPLPVARQQFPSNDRSFNISVLVKNTADMTPAISEATGLFRKIRKDNLEVENSFRIRRSDNLANTLIENLQYVTMAATVIGLITLLGAAIGLMNIMLVSVTERTKEIGTRKAIGAKQSTIRAQFLIEAIVICQLGGFVGIILGIAIGNGTAALIGSSFIIPWAWILLGVTLCFVTGVVAGFYPANKASRLDPVEALRYE